MMSKYIERLQNGIIKENPTFVMMLGMCPTYYTGQSSDSGIYRGRCLVRDDRTVVVTSIFACTE